MYVLIGYCSSRLSPLLCPSPLDIDTACGPKARLRIPVYYNTASVIIEWFEDGSDEFCFALNAGTTLCRQSQQNRNVSRACRRSRFRLFVPKGRAVPQGGIPRHRASSVAPTFCVPLRILCRPPVSVHTPVLRWLECPQLFGQ